MTSSASEELAVELFVPDTSRTFVLGTSKLGDALTVSNYDPEDDWRDVTCDLQGVSISRGTDSADLMDVPSVGQLTASFLQTEGGLDPTQTGHLVPNRRARVLRRATGEQLYAGHLENIQTSYDKEGAAFFSITAADSVKSLANTTRHGAVTNGGKLYELWHERIARLAQSADVPVELPGPLQPAPIWSVAGADSRWTSFGSAPTSTTRTVTTDPVPNHRLVHTTTGGGGGTTSLSRITPSSVDTSDLNAHKPYHTLTSGTGAHYALYGNKAVRNTLPLTTVDDYWTASAGTGAITTQVVTNSTETSLKIANADVTPPITAASLAAGSGLSWTQTGLTSGRRYKVEIEIGTMSRWTSSVDMSLKVGSTILHTRSAAQGTIFSGTFQASGSSATLQLITTAAESWTGGTGDQAVLSVRSVVITQLAPLWAPNADSFGWQKTLTGLTNGSSYTVNVRLTNARSGSWLQDSLRYLALSISGKGSGDSVRISPDYTQDYVLTYTFTATATSHILRVTNVSSGELTEHSRLTRDVLLDYDISAVEIGLSGSAISVPARSLGLTLALDNLQPEVQYRISATVRSQGVPQNYQLGVNTGTNETWSSPVYVAGTGGNTISLVFATESSTATVKLALASSLTIPHASPALIEDVYVDSSSLTILAEANPYKLQDVVYESSLANHFDLACNSVGAYWYVDAEGTVRFVSMTPRTPAVINLSDEAADHGTALHACIVDLQATYSTADVINDLTLENHGRNVETGDANDISYVYTEETSRITWGPNAVSIDTSLYEQGDRDRRAAAIFTEFANPSLRVSSVTYDAFEFTAPVELYDVVRIKFRGVSQLYYVVGIKHEVDSESWLTTLTVRKVV